MGLPVAERSCTHGDTAPGGAMARDGGVDRRVGRGDLRGYRGGRASMKRSSSFSAVSTSAAKLSLFLCILVDTRCGHPHNVGLRKTPMRRFSQRFFKCTGLAAYLAFCTGIAAIFHRAHDHGAPHLEASPSQSAQCDPHGDSHSDHSSNQKTHEPDCVTCHQLASATNAVPAFCVYQLNDDGGSGSMLPGYSQAYCFTDVLTSRAPRAPPIA